MDPDSAYRAISTTLSRWKDQTLNEADTRAKLIDPVFRIGLGWAEDHIVREEPVVEGYVDYSLVEGERRYALVEAKRTKSRFSLPARPQMETFVIGGPALSSIPARDAIRQAAGYAPNLGCPFAIVTNGLSYIVFQTLQALELTKRSAIVFSNIQEKQQFREFYELLCFEAVRKGSLARTFLSFEKMEKLCTPLDSISHPDNEWRRNKLWSVLNHLATRVLEDRPESRLEIIRHCYVPTQDSRETDVALRGLIQRVPRPLMRDSGSLELRTSPRGRTALGHELESAVKDRRPGVYILTGGVGSGKTTFLSRFEALIEPAIVSQYCAWFHIDFLSMAKPDAGSSDVIEAFIDKTVRHQVAVKYAAQVPTDGDGLRTLFAEELGQLESTLLFGLSLDSPQRREITNQRVAELFDSDGLFVRAALNKLIALGLRPVYVLDNSDQLGEDFQEKVVLIAGKLKDLSGAICLVSLRDDKFYAAYYRGVFNAFMTRKFHIGSPDLQEVLRLRLTYGLKLMDENPAEFLDTDPTTGALSLDECRLLIATFMHSVTHRNRNIVRMVESVASGNIRFGLEMFRDFVGSGNTDVTKILRSGPGYVVPFHEFAKSVILNNREFYRASKSDSIINVYARSAASRASHFTSLRILQYLCARQGAPSGHGAGFVDAEHLRDRFVEAVGSGDDFDSAIAHLVRKDLVDSEPPRSFDRAHAKAYQVGASGSYYLRYLVRSFAYVDLMLFDTAINDEGLARHLAATARERDLSVRVARVRRWIQWLTEQEYLEVAMCPRPSLEIMTPIMPEISTQLETEIQGHLV